jgi:hypothetical protein
LTNSLILHVAAQLLRGAIGDGLAKFSAFRGKDVMIFAGRMLHAEDVEETVTAMHQGLYADMWRRQQDESDGETDRISLGINRAALRQVTA